MSAGNRGFTLIEILVVVTIIAALMGLVVVLIGPANKIRDKTVTKTRIQTVASALVDMRQHGVLGDFPPDEMALLRGPKGEAVGKMVGTPNDTNEGIETVWVALHLNTLNIMINEKDKWLANTDNDTMSQNPTRSGSNELFEYVDAWNNPLAYFSNQDYKKYTEKGVPIMMRDGTIQMARPWRSEKTGQYMEMGKFQLFSAGPDEQFNTPDDVKSW